METTKEKKSDEIFKRASVCRTFRLNGLQEILKRTKLNIDPVILIWEVGDLSARGYIDSSVLKYVVNIDKAREISRKLHDPSPCELHQEWLKWYQSEYRKSFKVEDLAALLHHEAALFKLCPEKKDEDTLEFLQSKTQDYLWEYCQSLIKKFNLPLEMPTNFKQAFKSPVFYLEDNKQYDKSKEFVNYIQNLSELIKKLNMLEDSLTFSENENFLEFLGSLINRG